MRKWIAIRASAAVALVGSAATVVFSGAMAAVLLFAPARNTGPLLVRASGCAMAALSGGAGVWGICAGIGVFRRRNWARISMLILGGLLAFFGGTGALTAALVSFPMPAAVDQRVASILRTSIVGFYLALTLVGAWWLIVFNRPSSKQYFAEGGAVTESARPLSIGVIGWYLMISAIGTALCGVFRIPSILFGFVVAGWATLAVCTVLTGMNLYLGAGLLQLDEKARVGTIVYLSVMAANCLAMSAPGYDARMRAFGMAFQKYFRTDAPLMPNMRLFGMASVVYFAVPIWFLVRRRGAFVRER
jgi:hypothetical protein